MQRKKKEGNQEWLWEFQDCGSRGGAYGYRNKMEGPTFGILQYEGVSQDKEQEIETNQESLVR